MPPSSLLERDSQGWVLAPERLLMKTERVLLEMGSQERWPLVPWERGCLG